MSLITRMRKQNAIYWPPGSPDDFGVVVPGVVVALTLVDGVNSRVRWEDKVEEYLGVEGTVQHSNAVVYVPALPGGSEVALGGWLWLGDEGDLTDAAVPASNPGAFEVRRVDMLPTLKATEMLRTVYL